MYEVDKMKDVSKIIDYLKIIVLHHVRSFFWWGGYKSKKLIIYDKLFLNTLFHMNAESCIAMLYRIIEL